MIFPDKPLNIDPDPGYTGALGYFLSHPTERYLTGLEESELAEIMVGILTKKRDWPEFLDDRDFFDANDTIDV